MTRHALHAVTSTGRVSRTPFASMPTTAVRRWLAAHPDERIEIYPPLPPQRIAGSEPDAADRLDPAAPYAVHYVTNLRTGAAYQLAMVTGSTARDMLAASDVPARLVFVDVSA